MCGRLQSVYTDSKDNHEAAQRECGVVWSGVEEEQVVQKDRLVRCSHEVPRRSRKSSLCLTPGEPHRVDRPQACKMQAIGGTHNARPKQANGTAQVHELTNEDQ